MNSSYTYQVFTISTNRFPYRPYPTPSTIVLSTPNLASSATKIINFTNYNPIVEVNGCNTSIVASTTYTATTFKVSISSLPNGWTFVNSATSGDVSPSSTSNVTVKICVSDNAAAGVYPLILTSNITDETAMLVKAIMNVTVTKPVVFSTANSAAATTLATTSAAGGCS